MIHKVDVERNKSLMVYIKLLHWGDTLGDILGDTLDKKYITITKKADSHLSV